MEGVDWFTPLHVKTVLGGGPVMREMGDVGSQKGNHMSITESSLILGIFLNS
jgi:hypothetical protein